MRKLLPAFACVILFAACGDDNGNPTAPSTPASNVNSITVNLADSIKVGETTQASGTANMSNGSTQAVSSGWQSDNPQVATVTSTGAVAGVGNGRATIFVVQGGRQGQKVIRVVPDYQGVWQGRYTVNACVDSGIIRSAGGCASFFPGSSAPYGLTLTQSGEAVSGRMTLGQATTEAISSPIAADGGLQFNTVVNSNISRVDVVVRLNQAFPGQLSGTLNQNWIANGGFPGTMNFAATISSGAKTSGLRTVSRLLPTSLDELLRAVRH